MVQSSTGNLQAAGGAGGSGVIKVKELNKASGVWNLKSQLRARQQVIHGLMEM